MTSSLYAGLEKNRANNLDFPHRLRLWAKPMNLSIVLFICFKSQLNIWKRSKHILHLKKLTLKLIGGGLPYVRVSI